MIFLFQTSESAQDENNQVFIMYHHSDSSIANTIVEKLESHPNNLKCIMLDATPDATVASESVKQDAMSCRKILFLLSPAFVNHSIESHLVNDIYYNLCKKGLQTCIPVRIKGDIDEAHIPEGLMQLRHHTYEETEAFYSSLKRDIECKCKWTIYSSLY